MHPKICILGVWTCILGPRLAWTGSKAPNCPKMKFPDMDFRLAQFMIFVDLFESSNMHIFIFHASASNIVLSIVKANEVVFVDLSQYFPYGLGGKPKAIKFGYSYSILPGPCRLRWYWSSTGKRLIDPYSIQPAWRPPRRFSSS